VTDRTFTLAAVLAGLVIAAVVIVFLAAPPSRDVGSVITVIIGVPVTVFTGLTYAQARLNHRQLNGQMERHLEHVEAVGKDAAQAAAAKAAKSQTAVVRDELRAAAIEAVNQVMQAAMGEERAAKARRQGGR
jgi:mannitol-specific phosphotransferase system IIBC component